MMKQLFTLAMAVMTLASIAQSDYNFKEGYSIGDIASDFSLKNVDGEMVSMKGSFPDAKGYIVIFTCNHCPYAVMYEDRIVALNNDFVAQGYPVIAINPNDPEVVPDDSFEAMVERADDKGFTFPYLFDKGQHVFPLYGALKTPHVYLLDANLKVRYIGAIDSNPRDANNVEEDYLRNALNALMKGEEINPATTKAVGCRIKVKS
jgi:peroxiredoxin